MRTSLRRGLAVCAAAVLAASSAPAAEPTDVEQTRAMMHEIFAAFATLVRHTGDPEDFTSLENREEIVRSLQTLQRQAGRLERHAAHGGLSAAHRPVGRSLTEDVARALDHFVVGHYESARFLSAQLVENCFACHTKLPSTHRFAMGAELLASEPIASLPPERKALLAVAARQFDTALDLQEGVISDPHRTPVEIALSGVLESYLKVALRVRGDRDRALRTLTAFRERPDLPLYLQSEIGEWVEVLRHVELDAPDRDRLARAREQIHAARLLTAYPGDRRGLVNFVVASRWLHQHMADAELGREERAETLLWLGLCEVHISSSLWVSEAEWFLESAIRAAPETTWARTAYTTLEAVYTEGYSGAAGTYLPPEVERRLATLRDLLGAPESASEEVSE
jgi:hypothetical protein